MRAEWHIPQEKGGESAQQVAPDSRGDGNPMMRSKRRPWSLNYKTKEKI